MLGAGWLLLLLHDCYGRQLAVSPAVVQFKTEAQGLSQYTCGWWPTCFIEHSAKMQCAAHSNPRDAGACIPCAWHWRPWPALPATMRPSKIPTCSVPPFLSSNPLALQTWLAPISAVLPEVDGFHFNWHALWMVGNAPCMEGRWPVPHRAGACHVGRAWLGPLSSDPAYASFAVALCVRTEPAS